MKALESEYVRISKAAELLGTDVDTLLLAGVEHRIFIYALVCAWGKPGEDDLHDDYYYPYTLVTRFAKLLTDGEMKLDRLMRRTKDSTMWCSDIQFHKPDESMQSEVIAKRDHLFMLRTDIEELKKSTKPQEIKIGLESPQPKSAQTRRTDTLMVVIAALCKEAGIDPKTPGAASKIARMTDLSRTPVSESTIKALLDALPDAVAKRMK